MTVVNGELTCIILKTPPLGTAGSIKQAEQFLDETFVVISGDALTDFQLSEGIRFHEQKKRMVTMFVKEVENPPHLDWL